jgi:hypothetical protein
VLTILINNGTAIIAELNGLRPLLSSDRTLPVLAKSPPIKKVQQQSDKIDRVLPPLNQRDAKRLGVTAKTVARHRAVAGFDIWSQNKDPEGIAWSHDRDSQLFHPLG